MSDELKAWLDDKTYLMNTLLDMGADVVEVIRCKDCEYWNKDEDFLNGGICGEWSDFEDGIINYTKPDDYCSCGEPKEQENE